MVGTPASLTIAPTMQDFGSVVVGDTSAATTFTVTNSGDNASTALTVAIGGTDAGDFTITNDTCNGNALDGAATCTIDVTFTAGASGARTATLSATAATGGSATATLRGTGADPAALSITPTPHDFGGAVVNATSSDFTFTVTNDGDQTSGTITATLAGGDASHFAIVTNNCDGQTLAANATCTIVAHFAPTSSGAKTTTLSVSSSPGGTVTATLNGNGLVDATLEIAPLVQDFGSVTQGQSSANVTLIVTNNGDVDSGTLTSGLAGTDQADWTVVADSCANTIVAAGASCTVVLNFSPQSAGNKAASFDVSATPGGAASTTLTGVGLAPGSITISPTPQDFGTATVGQVGSNHIFTVQNTGGSPTGALSTALGGANPSEFPVVAGSNGCQGQVLPAGGTCTIAIQFAPTAAGNRVATLTVTGVPGGTAPASLSGTGLAPAQLNVAPPAQDFGSIGTDVASSPVVFTVTNLGDETSGNITNEILGTNFSQFNILGDDCTTLAGGASCTVTVEFRPTTTGTKVATLEVVASPGGTHNSILNGVGITPGNLVDTNPGPRHFDTGIIDADSPIQTITFRNTGQAPTAALTTSITGQFTIQRDTCVGQVLNTMETCEIDGRFEPRTSPGLKQGTLTVSGTPGGTVTVALDGTAVEKITLTPGPTTTFDDTKFEDSRPGFFVVTNNSATFGNAARTLAQSVSSTTGDEWSITYENCPNSGDIVDTLPAGQSCSITVTFEPRFVLGGAPGARSATLSVTGTGGAADDTVISSNALGPLEMAVVGCPTADARTYGPFATTVKGHERVTCVQVTNTALEASSVTGALSTTFTPAGDFAILSDNCAGRSLPGVGGSCIIEVLFFPQLGSPTDHSLTLKVRSTASFEVENTYSAQALDPANLVYTANTSDEFPPTHSTNTNDLVFTVTNTGEENAMNVSPSVQCIAAGSGCGIFSEQNVTCNGTVTGGGSPDPRDLGPGETCTITVRFAPLVTTVPDTYSARVTASGTAQLVGNGISDNMNFSGDSLSQLTVTPNPGSFPDTQETVTSAPITFTVTNNGSQVVNAPTATTNNPSVFLVEPALNNCATVPAGGSCTLGVSFTPPAAGEFDAVLTVGTIPGATGSSELDGTGITFPLLEFLPGEHLIDPAPNGVNFGGTTIGTPGEERTFTLRNIGQVTTGTITSTVTVVPPDGGLFGTTRLQDWRVIDNCVGTTLAPGASCTYVVRFNPAPGASTSAMLGIDVLAGEMTADPARNSSSSFRAFGWSQAAGLLTITPFIHEFGDVVEDLPAGSAPTATFTVTNNAATSQPLLGILAWFTNGGNPAGFSIVGGTCPYFPDQNTNGSLAAGATCTLIVRYNPTTSGVSSAFVAAGNINTFVTGFAFAGITGNGLQKATIVVDVPSEGPDVDFDDIYGLFTGIGSTRTATVTVRNEGDQTSGPISTTLGGAVPSAYSISGCAGQTLAKDEECDITITFAPAGAGLMEADLTISATPGDPTNTVVTIAGTGASQAALGITPQASQDCRNGNGGQDVPAMREVTCTQTYTVSNNTTAVPTGDLAFDVADGNFSVTGGTCTVGSPLGANATCTIEVSYKPLAAGSHSGTLSVSASPGGTVTAPVTGQAIAALSSNVTSSDFGCRTVDVGNPPTPFSDATLQFTNASGTGDAAPLTVNLTGADYAILSDGCTGVSLIAGDSCNVVVRFIPLAAGNNLAGSVTVSDGTANKTATVNLVGDGVTGACP